MSNVNVIEEMVNMIIARAYEVNSNPSRPRRNAWPGQPAQTLNEVPLYTRVRCVACLGAGVFDRLPLLKWIPPLRPALPRLSGNRPSFRCAQAPGTPNLCHHRPRFSAVVVVDVSGKAAGGRSAHRYQAVGQLVVRLARGGSP